MFCEQVFKVLGITSNSPRDVSLNTSRDQITVVSGHSGAGKNTMMQGIMANFTAQNVQFSVISTESFDWSKLSVTPPHTLYTCPFDNLEGVFKHMKTSGVKVLVIEQLPTDITFVSANKYLSDLRKFKKMYDVDQVIIGVMKKRPKN